MIFIMSTFFTSIRTSCEVFCIYFPSSCCSLMTSSFTQVVFHRILYFIWVCWSHDGVGLETICQKGHLLLLPELEGWMFIYPHLEFCIKDFQVNTLLSSYKNNLHTAINDITVLEKELKRRAHLRSWFEAGRSDNRSHFLVLERLWGQLVVK